MSTTASPPKQKAEIKIVSHSSLFYWWPVWAVGFLMAGITAVSGHRMTTLPAKTQYGVQASGELTVKEPLKATNTNRAVLEDQDVLILPKGGHVAPPTLHMAASKNLGVLFCTVLLLVISITNIPLRGLWSVIVIVVIVFLAIIFALM